MAVPGLEVVAAVFDFEARMPAMAVRVSLHPRIAFATSLAPTQQAGHRDESCQDYDRNDDEPNDGLLVQDEAFGVRRSVLEQ